MKFDKLLPLDPSFRIIIIEPEIRTFSPEIESQVDDVWQKAEKDSAGHLFNGQLISFLSYEPNQIKAFVTEFRYFFAQRQRPHLTPHLKICPLAISGRTWKGNNLLVGRRSALVLTDPLHYELAPSGTISLETMQNGIVDYRLQAFLELEEETGIKKGEVNNITPLGLFYTSAVPAVDICVDIDVKSSMGAVQLPSIDEYTELFWCTPEEARDRVRQNPDGWVPLSSRLIDLEFKPNS